MTAFWKFGRYIRDVWKVLTGGENDDFQRQIQNMEKQLARLRQRKLVQDKEREEFALDEARHAVKKIRDLHDSLMAADAATAKFAEKLGEKARAILEVQIQTSEKYRAAAVAKHKQFLQLHAKKCMEGNAELSSLELLAQLGKQGASTIQVEKLETLDQEKPRSGAVKAIQILPEESRHGDEQAGDLIMQAKNFKNIIQEEPTSGSVQATESLPGVSTQGDEQDAHLSMQEEKAESIDQEVPKRSVIDTTPLTDVEAIDEDTVFDPRLQTSEKYRTAAVDKQKQFLQEHAKECMEGNAELSSLGLLAQLGKQGAPTIQVEKLETLDQEKPRSGAVEAIQILPEESRHGDEQAGDLIMQAKTLENIIQEEPTSGGVQVTESLPGVSTQGDGQDAHLSMQEGKANSIDQEVPKRSVIDTTPLTDVEPIGEDTVFDPCLVQDTPPSSKALVSPKMQAKSDSPCPAPAIRIEEVETLNEEKPRSGAVEAIQVLPEASTHGAELTGDLIIQAKTLESINLQKHTPTVVEVAQVVPGVSTQGDDQDTNLLMQAEKADSVDQEVSTCFVMDTTPRTNVEPIGEDTGFDPHLKQDAQPSSKSLVPDKMKKAMSDPAPALLVSVEPLLAISEAKETRIVKAINEAKEADKS